MELSSLKKQLETLKEIPWRERDKIDGYSEIKPLIYQLSFIQDTRDKLEKKYKRRITQLQDEINRLKSDLEKVKKELPKLKKVSKKQLVKMIKAEPKPAPPPPIPDSKTKCYMCRMPHIIFQTKKDIKICPICVELNNKMRKLPSNFTDKFVVVTGGRIKVGYHTALHLLRTGATVLITTRFPMDALKRYKEEKDHIEWITRLHIVGADFTLHRDLDKVIETVYSLTKRVDVLINNAAQTIRRPKQFYRSLIDQEQLLLTDGKTTSGTLVKRDAKYVGYHLALDEKHEDDVETFPTGEIDIDGQQIDMRDSNSWTQNIEEVDIMECLETQLINSVAPFYLIQKLLPLMKGGDDHSWVLNITSAEGRFNKDDGKGLHPQNNMSKAALNMITKTIGKPYLKKGVLVTSIDIGWVNNMGPGAQLKDGMAILSYEDAVARIVHPINEHLVESAGRLIRHYVIREVW